MGPFSRDLFLSLLASGPETSSRGIELGVRIEGESRGSEKRANLDPKNGLSYCVCPCPYPERVKGDVPQRRELPYQMTALQMVITHTMW